MFARLVYFVVLIAAFSCAPNKNVTGIFYRLYVTNIKDFPLENGVALQNEKIFDNKYLTKIYIDSWLHRPNSYDVQKLIEAAQKTGRGNLLIFDWSNINNASKSSYDSVAAQVEEVGTALGKQLCEMIAAGLEPEKIEIIGFYLGAHVAGQAGRTVQTTCKHKIARIIGLDPALWKFVVCRGACPHRMMDKNDAAHTTVIRTTALLNTTRIPSLTMLDIVVNKYSVIQPGCPAETSIIRNTCDQIRSFDLYVESILHPNSLVAVDQDWFLACPIEDWDEDDMIPISISNDTTTAKGSYGLSTNSKPPYGKGVGGLCN